MPRLHGRVSQAMPLDSTALPRLNELDSGGSNLVLRMRVKRQGIGKAGAGAKWWDLSPNLRAISEITS